MIQKAKELYCFVFIYTSLPRLEPNRVVITMSCMCWMVSWTVRVSVTGVKLIDVIECVSRLWLRSHDQGTQYCVMDTHVDCVYLYHTKTLSHTNFC